MSEAPHPSQALSEVLEDLRRHLLWQQEEGGRFLQVDARVAAEARAAGLPRPAALARPPVASKPAPAPPVPPPAAPPPPPRAAAPQIERPQAPRVLTPAPPALIEVPAQMRPSTGALPGVVDGERPRLDDIRRELGDCRRCKLCTGRKNIVFGSGNPRAELVFVGEGPGETEDQQGVPFVGAAGQLLTKMIEAMGYRRDDIYICNVVKCRPPNNRNPEPDEVAACEPFLRAQLKAIQPKAIVALGKFAAQTLLRDSTPITRLRGNWRQYEGIQLMPTFHPAYLLRQPAEKRKAWEDLQQVMKFFGKTSGQRG
ncbi:uracil-DNA glycosylase [Cystobacter ferrugineus]|uniref:Type-4 uracil-DNA glycosylase n=1 Tax=Cystobacter ferrugineus TaxID=83449 RepID=A0A1L9B405_9BACT|nr:uracil-DNA glycosylase [Cystobacter ferrugineus]OJH36913.1 uracil-DNA glycosylase [Cystobacter ferrugineus]